MSVVDGVAGGLVGAAGAFAFSVLYNQMRTPVVKIARRTTNFDIDLSIDTVILSGQPGPGTTTVRALAYRVAVTNTQRLALNAAARNCIAWLELEGATERFQLSWVGGLSSVVINVGDQREIDLCALLPNLGLILGPTENGYPSFPRILGRRGVQLRGSLIVTSENGKRDEVRIQIQQNQQGNGLDVTFPVSVPNTPMADQELRNDTPGPSVTISNHKFLESMWDLGLTFLKIFGGLIILGGLALILVFFASQGALESGVPDLTYFTFALAIVSIGWSMIQGVQYYRNTVEHRAQPQKLDRQRQVMSNDIAHLRNERYEPPAAENTVTKVENPARQAPTPYQKDRLRVSRGIKAAPIGAFVMSGITLAVAFYSWFRYGIDSEFFLLDYPIGISTLMIGLSLLVTHYSDKQIHAHLDDIQR
ncbi:MAG: hypothetical protein ABSG45_09700 [Nitrososphaerales archaeon]|jgi:hypothetical protein